MTDKNKGLSIDACEGIVIDATKDHIVVLLPRGGKALLPNKGQKIGDAICYTPINSDIAIHSYDVAKTIVAFAQNDMLCYSILVPMPEHLLTAEEEEFHGRLAEQSECLLCTRDF